MVKKLTLAASFAFLAGCSILPDRPPLNYYDFSISPLRKLSFLLRSFRHPSESTSRILPLLTIVLSYTSRARTIAFYATNINRLVASPNDIIGDDLRQWLDRTGPWSMVLAPNSLASPDYQMTLYISELFANASSSAAGRYSYFDGCVSNESFKRQTGIQQALSDSHPDRAGKRPRFD